MVHSMTAFARQASTDSWGELAWELRTVNHRYLEMNFRLPEELRNMEHHFRECTKNALNRGKLEAILRYKPADAAAERINCDYELVKKLVKTADEIAIAGGPKNNLSSIHIMQWPGVIQVAEKDMSVVQNAALTLFNQALEELQANRQREGAALEQAIMTRLESMSEALQALLAELPTIVQTQREKLTQRLEETKVEVDTNRFEQEVVFILQKSDIAEEIDRLHTHVTEMHRVFALTPPIGRRMDFLLQEMNREANTIASKSISQSMTKTSVELKVWIEQIREQVQNIE